MKTYRLEPRNKSIGWMDKLNKHLLTTLHPFLLWKTWFGFEEVVVYEVSGKIVTTHETTYEDDDGSIYKINDYVIEVDELKQIGVMSMKLGGE